MDVDLRSSGGHRADDWRGDFNLTDGLGHSGLDIRAEAARARARADELGDRIAVCAARIDSATHELLRLIRAFDTEKAWARQGTTSTAKWLSWRVGLGRCAAREKVRVAVALGALPRIDRALERGEVSYAKVRAMVRIATPENEELLLAQAQGTTGAELERVCSGFRRVARGRSTDEEHRYVRRRTLQDGSVQIEMRLLPDEAELVWKALDEVREEMRERGREEMRERGREEIRAREGAGRRERFDSAESVALGTCQDSAESPALQMRTDSAESVGAAGAGAPPPVGPEGTEDGPRVSLADAAVAMAEDMLARRRDLAGRPGAERHTLFVHLSERDVGAASSAHDGAGDPQRPWKAELHDGVALSGETLLRLACDAGLIATKVDARGDVLDLGRRRRTVSPALRRALVLRDRGCRFPGCTHRAFVDAHHIEHWAQGGETSLGNTVLLCHHHHVAVHEGGFRVERGGGDGALRFLDPDGRVTEPAPTPPAEAGGLPEIAMDQRARGIAIDRRTSLPQLRPWHVDVKGCVRALAGRLPAGAET